MATRKSPGLLGTTPYGASGVVDFEYTPRGGHTQVALFTNPTTAGTVQVFRRGPMGERAMDTPQVVAANGEDSQLISFPVTGDVIVRFTDTSATAGIVSCEATDDGGG